MTIAAASFLFAAAWKGTLLVAFALVVHRVARNHVPSRWLCALLLIAIVRLLVPVGPSASFSVFNLVSTDAAVPSPMKFAVDNTGRAAARLDGLQPVVRDAPAAGTPWIPALLALWAAGVVFVIARAMTQTRRFQRQLAGSVDVDRDDVLALVEECRGILNVRRHIRLRITDAVATPALHGWLVPTLLLPQGFLDTFTRAQLRYVVLHELAHLRRSDVLINWIAAAAHALHWFNPLVRLAVARLAEERELACDALALAALRAEERPAYGGTVLELVDRLRATPAVPALVGMTATPQQLKRRIVMIASFRQSRHSLVFAALVVAVGLLTLTDARAGEAMKRQRMKVEAGSPAVHEVMLRLEKPMSVEFKEAGIEDVLHGVMNETGISVVIEDGTLDDATRAQRLNVKATNVPAHLVLFESLGTLHLAVRVTETGVLVLREPEEIVLRKIRQAENGERMFLRTTHPSEEPGEAAVEKRIEVIEEGERGGGKRKITLRTDGEIEEGKLEISLVEKE